MSNKRASPWSAADARAVLVEQVASGLSLSEFARREGIEEGRLYRWRRDLEQGTTRASAAAVPAARAKHARAAPAPAVIELRAAPKATERVEIVLASGVTLRVTEAIEPNALARLIAALR